MDVLKPLLTLLAVLNPIGVIPFFIHFTSRLSPAQRHRTTWIVTGTVFLVIAASALGGLQLLRFFGISIASFQVGGGVLLLINAVQMLNAEPADSSTRELDAANRKLDAGDSVAVSPLAVPLITGPATISTMIIYAEKSPGLADQAPLSQARMDLRFTKPTKAPAANPPTWAHQATPALDPAPWKEAIDPRARFVMIQPPR